MKTSISSSRSEDMKIFFASIIYFDQFSGFCNISMLQINQLGQHIAADISIFYLYFSNRFFY